MSKIFGVGAHTPDNHTAPSHDDSHTPAHHAPVHHEPAHHAPAHHTTDSHSSHDSHTHDVDVDIHDDHDHDVDVGQIAVDVLDTAEEIIIVAPVAGVDPSEIDIALSRNILTISGDRKNPPIYLDAKRMLVEECYYGSFSRSIILPENLAFNKIRATVDHNTIMVHVPKISFFSKNIKIEA